MPVHLTRIYTRTGDAGTTALVDGSRTSKADARLMAFGDCDEANSTLGVALALGQLPLDVRDLLLHVQNDLFDVGADLATPVIENPRTIPAAHPRGRRVARRGRHRPLQRPAARPHELRVAWWQCGCCVAARRPHDRAPGRTPHLGRARRVRRVDEPTNPRAT